MPLMFSHGRFFKSQWCIQTCFFSIFFIISCSFLFVCLFLFLFSFFFFWRGGGVGGGGLITAAVMSQVCWNSLETYHIAKNRHVLGTIHKEPGLSYLVLGKNPKIIPLFYFPYSAIVNCRWWNYVGRDGGFSSNFKNKGSKYKKML